MKTNILLAIIIISALFISCKQERPQQSGTTNTQQESDDLTIGIDVKTEIAAKKIIGKWEMIRVSKFYKDFDLIPPADITFNDDGTYEFNITLKSKGKLSYKGKWQLSKIGKRILINLSRTHRAFEGDWKEAPARELALIRFLNNEYNTVIINIVNPAWYQPVLKEEKNNYYKRVQTQ